MVGNTEIPSKAPSGAEGGTPTPSGSALAWEELSQQLSQLSSDLAHLRQWSLHTSRESEVARFRQWSFPSQSFAPSPRLSDTPHDFWDLEIIDEARDMFDFRAGLRAAPMEDALICHPSGEGYHDREDVVNPLAEALADARDAKSTSRGSELARFRQWSLYSQTPAPSPPLPDKSHDFWDLEIIGQARDMSDFRAGLRAAQKEDALIRYSPGEGYHDREALANTHSGAKPPLPDKSHDFWDLETIGQVRDMSDFRAGLYAVPKEDALIRFRRPEYYHPGEDVGNGLAEVYNCNSRLRESSSSLTTATQVISSWSFGSSTFGGPYSIGTAQQASSRALLRDFKRAPSQFQPQSSSTPKRLNNLASGSMSVEAEYRKVASSRCGPSSMNLVFCPPTTAFQSGCSRRFGDITNSQARYVGPAQSWQEHSHSGSLMARYFAQDIYPWSFDNPQTPRGVQGSRGVWSTARCGSPRQLQRASNGFARFLPQASSTPNRATERAG
ncbi:hypothetical protein B0H13DRAFT_2543610 [Mycena leptocephala]|nr:hypothetical protein B0H13DRAFT_2543610 [Mycena leptocephala]